jgi:DNA-binding Lrp family transcriptional regulator
VIDALDRKILHAMHLDPRIGYARLGAVLGVSEQTAARRYLRMRFDGLVRVVALTTPAPGTVDWTVRLSCRPGSAAGIGAALARRPDVNWINVTAGGAELSLVVRGRAEFPPDGPANDDRADLLRRLPEAGNVLSMSAHQTLHRFPGRGELDWVGLDSPLAEEQREQVLAGRPPRDGGPPVEVTAADRPLLDALVQDGRAGYAALAQRIGWPQRQVARRIGELTGSGALYFDIDIAMPRVGFRSQADLWLTVEPARLHAVGETVADHAEVPYAAAVTGRQNIRVSLLCRDAGALYRYLTTSLASVEGVQQMEIAPILHQVKQAGSLVSRGRLTPPPPSTEAAA